MKILAFDGWTQGAHHLTRLLPFIHANGDELLLLHIGSWGHDVNRPKQEVIDGMLTRDISYYDKLSIPEILRKEAPDLVIFLSTRSLSHLSFNSYCRSFGIPTYHLYHGLVSVQALTLNDNYGKKRLLPVIKLLFDKAYKNLRYMVPTYLKALYENNASLIELGRALSIIFRRLSGDFYDSKNPYVQGSSTDFGLVYTEDDKEHMKWHYRVLPENIGVIGNPELIDTGLSTDDILHYVNVPTDDKVVIYVDTGFLACGLVYSNENEFITHIRKTRKILTEIGYYLQVRLHPMHKGTNVEAALAKDGIVLLSKQQFLNNAKFAAAVITEPSSIAMAPCMLGRPLLLARFGPLAGQQFGQVLIDYPLARPLDDLCDLDSILEEICNDTKLIPLQKWIDRYCGPLPFEMAPQRAVEWLKLTSAK